MKRIFMIGILFFMVACQPSVEAIQKAIEQTQVAAPRATTIPTNTPIPTPTQMPLSDIDLSAIAIVAGDLPAGYYPAQIRSDPPKMFSGVKNYENTINQQFENKGDTAAAGGVTIFLFNEISDRDNAYKFIVDGFGSGMTTDLIKAIVGDLDEIGEKGKYVTNKTTLYGIVTEFSDLAFVRCSAVVHIRMSDTTDIKNLSSYAERLDQRLSDLVCQ